MEEKNFSKLTESLELNHLEDDCIALNDENAEEIYGGWGVYQNCCFNNCKL